MIHRMALILCLLAAFAVLPPAIAPAEEIMIEDFENAPETRWRFFTDGVMGGVSSGRVTFLTEQGRPIARMTGEVSTANNGGFIQMRHDLPAPPPADAQGVRLEVRGNGARYFVHLRTRGTMLPWQYYQAGFDAPADWVEVRLPFTAFAPSGRLLRATPRPGGLTSVAIVAYGRDYTARVDVREIGFY